MDRHAASTPKRRHWTGSLLPVLGAALLWQAQALALDARPGARMHAQPPALGVREPPRMSAGVSIDRVIEQIERRYNARVVRNETVQANGRAVYKLRLLSDDGRVFTVQVDAETGRVL